MAKPQSTLIRVFLGVLAVCALPACLFADYKVQSGRVEVTAATVDIPVASVYDMSRAFVLISPGTGSVDSNTDADIVQVRGYLQAPDNIRFERTTSLESTWVSYQLIECTDNEFTAYRGSSFLTSTELSKIISIGATVNPADCLAIVTADNDTSSQSYYNQAMLTARVSSSTQLTIERNSSGSAAPNFNWVVVEFDPDKIAGIQHGSTNVDSNTYSSPKTVNISGVDPDRSILIFQIRPNDNDLTQVAWAGNFVSPNQIKFYQHDPVSAADIEWYVIDFGAGATHAQRGVVDRSLLIYASWYTADVTLSPAVDTYRTMYFHSLTCDSSGAAFPNAYATAEFTSSTNLRIQRMRNGEESYIEWQTLRLPTTCALSGSTILPDVNMTGLGIFTNSNGNYIGEVPYGFSGTVTPVKDGYSFEPPSLTYDNVTAGFTPGQNYLPRFTISGSAGLPDVDMTGLDVLTDSNGNYSAIVDYGWSGTVTPVKTGYTFSPTDRSYSNVTDNQTNQDYTPAVSTFTISGAVEVPDVNMTGLGVLTDSNGNYSGTVDYGWSGTVTPAKAGYTFSPTDRSYSNVTSDQTNQDYTPTLLTYTISGAVELPDVNMTGLGVLTDSNGNYSGTVDYGWSGTVTPVKDGYTFSPTDRSYSNVTSDQTNQDYTPILSTYTISGAVELPDVEMTGLGVITDSNGDYIAGIPYGWSGTVTPVKAGYTFSPTDRSYSNVTSDQTNQDYTPTLLTYIISGAVELPDVNMTGLGVITDSNGDYSKVVDYGWSGTVTPVKAGYTFSPTDRSYSNVTSDQTNQDYTPTLLTYTISGAVEVPDVNMTGLGVLTDSNGNYSAIVDYGFSGTVTPVKDGYTFSPTDRSYSNVTSDQTNQDYTPTLLTYTISGAVGLADVNMTGLGVLTDSNGNYSATVDYGWSDTVTPVKERYSFEPAEIIYSFVTSDQSDQNYTPVLPPGPPFALDATVLTYMHQPVLITLNAVDDNAPETLTYIIASLPQNGTLTDPNADPITTTYYFIPDNNSNVTYTPDANYAGTDSFSFIVDDGGTEPDGGWSNEATVTIDVIGYFTELFDANDNDLDNQMLTFIPDGSAAFYLLCRDRAEQFPTDPCGGSLLSLTDDDYMQINLVDGKNVAIYGNSYSSFYVGSNGYVTFEAGDTNDVETLDIHFSAKCISALFDDLDPSVYGTVSFKQLSDRAVVTFDDIAEYATANSNSFQIELFFNGTIRLTYLNIDANDGLAGLSDGGGIPANFVESDLLNFTYCADFDTDRDVDLTDLANLAENWLLEDCPNSVWCNQADLDRSSRVDLFDFGHFAGYWTGQLVAGGFVEVNDVFYSIDAEDGRVWDVNGGEEGVGANPTDTAGWALRLGDYYLDSTQSQHGYRNILSFDTSTLPADATLVSAMLDMTCGYIDYAISPFVWGANCLVDIASPSFEAVGLEPNDWQALADAYAIAAFTVEPNLSQSMTSTEFNIQGLSRIDINGKTQLRVYFENSSNNDPNIDYIGFYPGAKLTVNYSVPDIHIVEFNSVAVEDGRVWAEFNDTSQSWEGIDANSDSSDQLALRLGDYQDLYSYRTIVSFDTSSLPDDCTIMWAKLRMTPGTTEGTDPFDGWGGACYIDIASPSFGPNTLEPDDWQIPADVTAVAQFYDPNGAGQMLSEEFNTAGENEINKYGTTQLRVYFENPINPSLNNDCLYFYSGEATDDSRKPKLIIEYWAK